MEIKEKLVEIIDKSSRGYLDHNLYISRIWKEIFKEEIEPEMVQKINYFVWSILALDHWSGSPVRLPHDELQDIINKDYSVDAYRKKLAELDENDRSRDWYEGIIQQLEREGE